MRRSRTLMARGAAGLVVIVLAVGAAGCGGSGGDAGKPEDVVRQALDLMETKDVDGLAALACAGQEETIRDQLGLPGAVGSGLLPGLDTGALLDAVELDTSKVEVGSAKVEGDVAQVPVEGDLGLSFDKEAMRPILRQVLESQGQAMTDEQIDAMLGMLDAYGQAVPLKQEVRLVREDGAWKVCEAP